MGIGVTLISKGQIIKISSAPRVGATAEAALCVLQSRADLDGCPPSCCKHKYPFSSAYEGKIGSHGQPLLRAQAAAQETQSCSSLFLCLSPHVQCLYCLLYMHYHFDVLWGSSNGPFPIYPKRIILNNIQPREKIKNWNDRTNLQPCLWGSKNHWRDGRGPGG